MKSHTTTPNNGTYSSLTDLTTSVPAQKKATEFCDGVDALLAMMPKKVTK